MTPCCVRIPKSDTQSSARQSRRTPQRRCESTREQDSHGVVRVPKRNRHNHQHPTCRMSGHHHRVSTPSSEGKSRKITRFAWAWQHSSPQSYPSVQCVFSRCWAVYRRTWPVREREWRQQARTNWWQTKNNTRNCWRRRQRARISSKCGTAGPPKQRVEPQGIFQTSGNANQSYTNASRTTKTTSRTTHTSSRTNKTRSSSVNAIFPILRTALARTLGGLVSRSHRRTEEAGRTGFLQRPRGLLFLVSVGCLSLFVAGARLALNVLSLCIAHQRTWVRGSSEPFCFVPHSLLSLPILLCLLVRYYGFSVPVHNHVLRC